MLKMWKSRIMWGTLGWASPPLLQKKWKRINPQAHTKCQIHFIWMQRAFMDHEQVHGMVRCWARNEIILRSCQQLRPQLLLTRLQCNKKGLKQQWWCPSRLWKGEKQSPIIQLSFKSLHPVSALVVPNIFSYPYSPVRWTEVYPFIDPIHHAPNLSISIDFERGCFVVLHKKWISTYVLYIQLFRSVCTTTT